MSVQRVITPYFFQITNTLRVLATTTLACTFVLVAACSSGSSGDNPPAQAEAEAFELLSLNSDELTLIEGDSGGLIIPLELERTDGHSSSINLSIAGLNEKDTDNITTSFSTSSLSSSENQSQVNLQLALDVAPILSQQRKFRISATDGEQTDEITVTVNIEPVDRDDVYLLIGQSNMVGFGGDGTKESGSGEPDEPDERIKQFNVSKNSEFEIFLDPQDYLDINKNFLEPRITNAIDPLHVPVDEFTLDKAEDYVGMGLSFAKAALPNTSKNIILVPAAWSGTSFCNTSLAPAHWNALPTEDPNLGNTLLFDRALTRINHALNYSGGVLRGILWHQGESDSNIECSAQYGYNLTTLATELRKRINPDMRGTQARGEDANIPFIVGTMSRGIDERDDLSQLSPEKSVVDLVHRNISSSLSHSAVSIHDDLTPANGYPCGNTSCIHFGTRALREMGNRYYQKLQEVLAAE